MKRNPIIYFLMAFHFGWVGATFAQQETTETEPTKAAAKQSLLTKVYEVAPSFPDSMKSGSENRSGAAADPFADPVLEDSAGKIKLETVQDGLESVGITFEDGASATYDKKTSRLTVTNTANQIELVEVYLDVFRGDGEKQILIYLEYIEVDHSDFSDWLFENVMESDGTELRNEVQRWSKEGRAEIIDSATVLARSGQRAKAESVNEFIYPTEYDPPEIPSSVTLKDGAEAPISAATPTALETRNLGTTMEVDPVLGADNFTIDLNLSPENVKLEAIEQWHRTATDPRFKTHMPTFYTMKISTQVTTQHGRYTFLGTTRPLEASDPNRKNPIVLQFVRGDILSVTDWKEVEGAKEAVE